MLLNDLAGAGHDLTIPEPAAEGDLKAHSVVLAARSQSLAAAIRALPTAEADGGRTLACEAATVRKCYAKVKLRPRMAAMNISDPAPPITGSALAPPHIAGGALAPPPPPPPPPPLASPADDVDTSITLADALTALRQDTSRLPFDMLLVPAVDKSPDGADGAEAGADGAEGAGVEPLPAHASLLIARSIFFRSFSSFTTVAGGEGEAADMPRVDCSPVTRATLEIVLSAIYGSATLPLCGEPSVVAVEVFDAATYLGVSCAMRLAEEAMVALLSLEEVSDALAWAKARGAERLTAGCQRLLRKSFSDLLRGSESQQAALLSLPHHVLIELLSSDLLVLEHGEDDVALAVLTWAKATPVTSDVLATAVTSEAVQELWRCVRTPQLDPLSAVAKRAEAFGLYTADQKKESMLFRTDPIHRGALLSTTPNYTVRLAPTAVQQELRAKELDYVVEMSRPQMMQCCRMLGVVNGRCDFTPLTPVRWSSEAAGAKHAVPPSAPSSPDAPEEQRTATCCATSPRHLVLGAPAHVLGDAGKGDGDAARWTRWLSSRLPPELYARLLTTLAPPPLSPLPLSPTPLLGIAALSQMREAEVRSLLASMLRCENALRLDATTQQAYTALGESETHLSLLTAAVQRAVALQHGVEAEVGVQLLRSAATLTPDLAQEHCHWVRFNRAMAGALKAGDAAPDVALASLTGSPTRLSEHLPAAGPCLLLAASYT